MPLIAEIAISVLLVVAGLFGLVGSYGLLRLPDAMTRLHAPTKATTVGVGGVLLASMLYFAVNGSVSWHELLIALFLFLTAPITANLVAKAHMHREMSQGELPDSDTGRVWATFERPGAPIAPVLTSAAPVESAKS
ncbi:Na+/H+ antiporter subunit G [Fertoebacter nigrum]|uniref:Na+/H+ antiporter subunit G n=1 Tax=Fertoeibacter niger TaxID=2656921 RepID=A0A8X8GZG4_9RHOB|nr:Na+/H+ antiporter subunit G [Fertoeibacter niger]NUB44261.1 Na+/H+ antiporter subunit G [Fertoeibacter niger]